MEVIRIPGYTEDEKINIGKRYLLPKQMRNNGVREDELALGDDALRGIVRYYTRESGVRSLEREIAKVCRKVVKEHTLSAGKSELSSAGRKTKSVAARATGKTKARAASKVKAPTVTVDADQLNRFLGVRKFSFGLAEDRNEVGVVTGLAWTQAGGDLLSIEAAVVPGKGKLLHTGQLGEVMQESIQAALSVVRARAQALGIDPDFHQKYDLHVHVPEGATPKDGPSAGIAMATALVSALTNVPVRADVAMTGEITLRGRVLPIGGLKEKLLAAHRGGIKRVLIPEDNRKDLVEIPANVTDFLDIRPVKWIDEVLQLALVATPAADGSALKPADVKPVTESDSVDEAAATLGPRAH